MHALGQVPAPEVRRRGGTGGCTVSLAQASQDRPARTHVWCLLAAAMGSTTTGTIALPQRARPIARRCS